MSAGWRCGTLAESASRVRKTLRSTEIHEPFHHALQFPHVAWPGIGLKQIHIRRSQAGQSLSCSASVASEKIPGQHGDIFFPLTQGKTLEGEYVEQVKEVAAKGP